MLSTIGLAFGRILRFVTPAVIVESKIGSDAKVEGGSKFYFSTIDRHSFCGYHCDIFHTDIGAFTSIADGVVISGGRHPMEWAGMSPVFYSGRDSVKAKFSKFDREPVRRTYIGSDVWIGRSAMVMEGVSIGHGAVVGAGSVVTKDVPPYALVAGNPARLLRYRFGEETIKELLAIQWWGLGDAQIADAARYVKSPLQFVEALRDREPRDD